MMTTEWKESKIIIDGLMHLLACTKCKKTPERPMRYVNCGHFFCDICIYGDSNCYQCKIPVRPNEIRPYWMLSQLIQFCQIISNVTTQMKPGNIKILAKKVHAFVTELNGLVPETDSESEEEIIESTPPARKNRIEGNKLESLRCLDLNAETSGRQDLNCSPPNCRDEMMEIKMEGCLDSDESSSQEEDLESAAPSGPIQVTNNKLETSILVVTKESKEYFQKQNPESETLGFVDPTQVTSHFTNNNAIPKRTEFVNPNDNVETETVGFIDPTQFSPRRKKNDQTKNKKNVSPTGLADPETRNQSAELENEGYTSSPGSHSPVVRDKNIDAESEEFVSPSQRSPYWKKKMLEAGEKNVESVGFVESTQFTPRRRKRSLEAPVSAEEARKESPARISGYRNCSTTPPRPKRICFPEKTCKFFMLKSTTEEENEDPEKIVTFPEKNYVNSKGSKPATIEENWSLDKNISSMESSEFIEPTQEAIPQRKKMDFVLAPESASMHNTASSSVIIPESFESIDTRINDDGPMGNKKISPNEVSPRKSLRLASQEKNQKVEEKKAPNEDKISSKEVEEETPSEKLRRIKSLMLSRRSKFRRSSQTSEVPKNSLNDDRKSVEEKIETKSNPEVSAQAGTSADDLKNEKASRGRITPSPRLRRSKRTPIKKNNQSPKNKKKVKSLDNALYSQEENKTARIKQSEKMTNFRNREKLKVSPPKTVPKNLSKRNAKGESPLHTACIKGQVDYVRMLLKAGANPNTKDNASWTPLQEAVDLGKMEISQMLLQAGASVDTPGMDNRTALHEAAARNKLEEAALLLRFNANRNVYDKHGKKPIDYAVSDEMRALLAGDKKIERIAEGDTGAGTFDQSITIPNSRFFVFPSNLNSENRKLLNQLASKLKISIATTFRPSVTHLVVETNERNITELTYDVMLAILQGKWILNSQWITISKDLEDISEIDLELFEVHGAPNLDTPIRARLNEEVQNPRLFNNCSFYFAIGPRCTWSYEKFEFTKETLTNLVLGGQGEILNREPDPEDVKDCKLTPFHVANTPIHPLFRCSYYIIYMPGKDEPRVKYNMPHLKSLPVGWFLECIEKFSLVDPLLMGIT